MYSFIVLGIPLGILGNQKELARLALDQEARGKREEDKPPRRMVAPLVITLMVVGGIAVWIA
jgi:hypothetical protein